MHILTNNAPVDLGSFGTLGADEWLLSDRNAFEIAALAPPRTIRLQYFAADPCPTKAADTILIQRSGAWGDLMFLTPVLTALSKRYPHLAIALSCHEKHHPLFTATTGRSIALLPYPLRTEDALAFDTIISLEEVVEQAEGHVSTALGKAFGITMEGEDIHYGYYPLPAELALGEANYPRTGKKRISVQFTANAINRSYHPSKWMALISGLHEKGYETFIFGSPHQLKPFSDTNLLKKIDTPFREAAAVMKTCDVHVGVDSSWLHMAAALGIPAVGLFGATDWKQVVMPGSDTISLTGPGACARCRFIPHAGRHFPKDMPCAKAGFCTVLAGIPVSRIIAKVEQQLNSLA